MARIRCVLDLQGAQGESRFRGIGRYTLNFARAMARTAGEHEVWFALNSLFPGTADELRMQFEQLVPKERIVTFAAPGPVSELDPSNSWRRCAAERIREHFLAGLAPDVVHMSSVAEGFVDNCITSVGVHDCSFATAATFYDAIPLLHPKKHLFNSAITNYYLRKMQWMKRTDVLFAISESSRKEAIDALQIPEDRVVNISTGLEEQFRVLELSPQYKSALLKKYGISKPFIMYSGAIDVRKNVEGLIAAIGHLPPRLRDTHQLLIAGKNDANARKTLQDIASRNALSGNTLVFSGFVDNNDLIALYNLCALFVLPSLHEGFGLPVLEAMACGAPAIASNVTSLPEVIGREDAMFDPHQPSDIAAKIEYALTNDSFREALRDYGLQRCKKFTWDATAHAAWSALERLKQQKLSPVCYSAPHLSLSEKLKLAYFSPLPPEKSGIADYGAELLPELARYYDINVVVEQQTIENDWINANFPVRSASWFERHAVEFDRVLYQMGNSPFHVYVLDVLRRYPGLLVLHDFFLSGMFRWLAVSSNSPDKFSREIFESHGYLGLLQEKNYGTEWAVTNLPCSRNIIESAAGVIVHSDYSRRQASSPWCKSRFIGKNI